MEWNGILSLVYGLLAGFTGLLPVSADAHQRLFLEMTGIRGNEGGFDIACHLAVWLALFVAYRPQLMRLRRERRLAAVPARKRRRHPDYTALKEDRFLRTAMVPAVIFTAGLGLLRPFVRSLWMLSLLLFLSGLLLYLPQFFHRGNKVAETVSGLDGLLMGIASGVASVPGLSGFAGALCAASLRGLDRQFAADNALLLMLAVLPLLICFDIYGIVTSGGAMFSFGWLLLYFMSAVAAFSGAWLSVKLVQFLAVRVGFSAFSYYCWGMAFFIFALYLMI